MEDKDASVAPKAAGSKMPTGIELLFGAMTGVPAGV
jgi:hypothetical protein